MNSYRLQPVFVVLVLCLMAISRHDLGAQDGSQLPLVGPTASPGTGAGDGPSEGPSEPDEPSGVGADEPCANCDNEGKQWVNPRSRPVHHLGCDLHRTGIQVWGYGVAYISYGTLACWAEVHITPGHWGKTSKNCYNAELDSSDIVKVRIHSYECSGWGGVFHSTQTCTHTGERDGSRVGNYEESNCGGVATTGTAGGSSSTGTTSGG